MNFSSLDGKPVRANSRSYDQIRPVRVTYDAFGYASGTVLFELGNTKVLCAISLNSGVPAFLKGSKTGWLTAEYAMLPTATVQRTQREAITQKRSGRGTEISRLIGRALRAVTNMDVLGEKTITIDCDVLQADGGTRTAAISGAYLALREAEQRWLADKIINQPCVISDVSAISVGIIEGVPMVDLDCGEDNNAQVDFNFMLNSAGDIIEIQGSVEHGSAISWDNFEAMRLLAVNGVQALFASLPPVPKVTGHKHKQKQDACASTSRGSAENVPLFCLKNRLENL
jgi:ribonuclease PH